MSRRRTIEVGGELEKALLVGTDFSRDGAGVGTVNIDPIVYGAAYVMKF